LKGHVRDSRFYDTSRQEGSELLCIKTPSFLREFSNQSIRQKTTGNALSDAPLKSRFENFAAGAAKKTGGFYETALRALLIDQIIRGQTF